MPNGYDMVFGDFLLKCTALEVRMRRHPPERHHCPDEDRIDDANSRSGLLARLTVHL